MATATADIQNGAPLSSRPEISRPIMAQPMENNSRSAALDARLRQYKELNGLPRAFYPGGDRSLSGIALRAFLLGSVAVLGLLSSVALVFYESRLWRPPFFIGTLCIFHFLEFYTTAEFNTPTAFVSSFLLSNGSRYRQAHTCAFVETLVTSYFLPGWQARVSPLPMIALGLIMIVVGQVVRSLAMAHAGTNFNHQVQSQKNDGHELVTTGLYAYFRHPSYFGFFWWGLGTQVALGNTVCLVGYAGVLWYFFNHRIRGIDISSPETTMVC